MAEKILVYQLFPGAWGSIRMMTLFLPRIVALDVDYICLCPIFESPWKNAGYDVADYYTIEPKLGTMKDFDEFVESAHAMSLKVILDLPIDSTSVEHSWFLTEPHRYVIKKGKMPDFTRRTMLGDSLAWQKTEDGDYYLALNHPAQATLNWFNGGVLNRGLVECFKKIMSFWTCAHKVDGFRLEFVQLINESPEKESDFEKVMIGRRAVTVINELSNNIWGKSPFLVMDCIDRDGKACDFYSKETDIEFITNRLLRSTAIANTKTTIGIKRKITALTKNPKFMLNLESHDVPRFTSRSGLPAIQILKTMFSSNANAICLYQGQELGLENPEDISIQDILRLDSRKELRHENSSISNETLRRESCANSRVPLPLNEYAIQESDPGSTLGHTMVFIQKWKHF